MNCLMRKEVHLYWYSGITMDGIILFPFPILISDSMLHPGGIRLILPPERVLPDFNLGPY